MTFVSRTNLALFSAVSMLAFAAAAEAQDSYGRLPPNSVLVTPQGDILDYIPDSGEVRMMRDRRGRTVLVDSWGNVVATVMGSGRQGDGMRRRERNRDVYTNPDYGYSDPAFTDQGYSRQGDITGSIPDYRDVAPGDVDRQELPASLPMQDENDMAALPPEDNAPQRQSLPSAARITKKSSAEITALQVFLDREGFSPGVIDGKTGSNVTKAIEAWQQATGETLDPNNTDDILERLRFTGGLPITTYIDHGSGCCRSLRRLHSGRLCPQGSLAASLLHIDGGNAGREVPHGRSLSARIEPRHRLHRCPAPSSGSSIRARPRKPRSRASSPTNTANRCLPMMRPEH